VCADGMDHPYHLFLINLIVLETCNIQLVYTVSAIRTHLGKL
jgi:hypothetical protein